MPIGHFLDEPDALTAAQITVDLYGPIHGMRAVLPRMTARGRSHIVNIASLAGKSPAPGGAVYSATKFAVLGLSRSVRAEFAATGVSAVLPSLVRTDLGSGATAPSSITLDPSEVATAIVHSVRHRRAEIAVPRWLGVAIDVSNVLPGVIQETARRLIGLTTDIADAANASPDRADYLRRINNQTTN